MKYKKLLSFSFLFIILGFLLSSCGSGVKIPSNTSKTDANTELDIGINNLKIIKPRILIVDMFSDPKVKDMKTFYKLMNDMGIKTFHEKSLPNSVDKLLKYPLVIFGTCSLMSFEEVQNAKTMLAEYVDQGGSLIYLASAACIFSKDDKTRKYLYANEISSQWGMTFLDDSTIEDDPLFKNVSELPLGEGWTSYTAPYVPNGMQLYSSRLTSISVDPPARPYFSSYKGPFLAMYDDPKSGFVVGIANESFLGDESISDKNADIPNKSNFILLGDMINWMINRSVNKMSNN